MYIPFKALTGACKVHGVRTEVMPDGVSETICEASIEYTPLPEDSKVKAVVHLHAIADEDDATAAFVHDIESTLNPICLELDSRGKCIGISDYDELCKRWDNRLSLLRVNYEGEWVEKELQLLTDRVHDKGLLLNMMKRYYVFSEWMEADWSGIEFTEGKGYREHEETALGVPLLFSQDCSIEDNEEEMSLHIVGNADLRKNEGQLDKISLLGETQHGDITSIEQHCIVKAVNLTGLPQSLHCQYTVKGYEQVLKNIEISLTFQ
ncbi:hypothetical protein CTI16_10495 [Prevotella intermedia]|jgi:hypothetical protein|uniref:Uncharacterized protein n=1 Tax=Prevotella intermedia TaxID=28131 RepID=A0AAJ3V8V1_PREIN|nr:hypothetical protein [Prevotella intermedia]ATV39075.1 hypothetical protein CUB95_10665 [Prevotella intermedia]PIK17413.1 hypothetical protein CTI16_10495 [Prevotella intermedia]